MARFVSVLGFLDGKLQNTVTATVKGQSTIRAYQPNVSNPATEKQVSNRDVMTYITNLANFLNFAVLVPYLTPKSRVQSPINSFNSQLGRIITLIADELQIMRADVITNQLSELAASNLMIANGSLSLIQNGAAQITAGTTTSTSCDISFPTQTANYSRNDLPTDQGFIVAVNVTAPKSPAVTNTNSPRSNGGITGTCTLPAREATDIILLFAFYKSTASNNTSKGMVFGRLVGTTFTATVNRPYTA